MCDTFVLPSQIFNLCPLARSRTLKRLCRRHAADDSLILTIYQADGSELRAAHQGGRGPTHSTRVTSRSPLSLDFLRVLFADSSQGLGRVSSHASKTCRVVKTLLFATI